ncbi:hypothetical protein MBLNU13_g08935t2 [Cladosporium sp. NU13]
MCIHYTIEFWTPNPNPNADVERRALRGILAPGQNRAARQREFWLHDCDYLSSPRCRGQDIREGGVYYGRVFEFCFDDVDCRARIEQFEAEYEHYGREVRRSEQRREPEARQNWLAQQWLRACNDWGVAVGECVCWGLWLAGSFEVGQESESAADSDGGD